MLKNDRLTNPPAKNMPPSLSLVSLSQVSGSGNNINNINNRFYMKYIIAGQEKTSHVHVATESVFSIKHQFWLSVFGRKIVVLYILLVLKTT